MTATNCQITVKYWLGTLRQEAVAGSYEEAMEIASRNQNAYEPKFYDPDGVRLYDLGNCLAYEAQDGETTRAYA